MLGQRIAALRHQADMSQAELAQLLKISPSTVGMYEQDRREPSLQTLARLAEVFSVSTDYLITGKAADPSDGHALEQMLLSRLAAAEKRMESRRERPFSRQELAVLFAAMLMEP